MSPYRFCSSCQRPIVPRDSASRCSFEGCDQPICPTCQATVYRRFCTQHQLPVSERLLDARRRYEKGEFPLLVNLNTARERQQRYLNRFDSRIARVKYVVNPVDHRRHIKGRTAPNRFPDRPGDRFCADLAYSKHYFFTVSGGSTLVLEARVIGRGEAFEKDGFDILPLSEEELGVQIQHLNDEICGRGDKCTSVVALASITGWSNSVINAWRNGGGYDHPALLLFLVDLHSESIVYHWHRMNDRQRELLDTLADEVFSPPGELLATAQSVQEYLELRSSIDINTAASSLQIRPSLALQTFKRLAREGDYRILQADSSSPVLVRGRL